MRMIGLTGGIASGKSTVAGWLRDAGVPVIDADQLAREVVAAGTSGLAEVVGHFGDGILTPTGALDRAALAARIFGDDEARQALNRILHPRIAALARERADALSRAGHAVAVYEAALLFENRLEEGLDATILVAVPEDVQVERLVERDALGRPEAEARLRAQLPLREKRARATRVIDNSGTRAQTAQALVDTWLELTGQILPLPRIAGGREHGPPPRAS